MKITDSLYACVKALWEKAANKEFLIKMAEGTLDEKRYSGYMLQDYYYLVEYKKILERLLELSEDSEVTGFLKLAIDVTVYETESVHLPAMKKLGISEDTIKNTGMNSVITDYVAFYHDTIDKNGLLGGFTALLQCCWDYAYLGKVMYENYGEKIEKSQYKFWFDAYTSKEYVETNEKWQSLVDKLTTGTDDKTKETLCNIFKTCAEFENKFWDVL
ncbi:MAG: hypothetical protein IJL20_00785 [Lachnospiraceae bacterium]|nr:hypothetical protein [Lachnospiraceae bacterium]